MVPLRYFRAAISNPASLQIVAGLAIDSLAEDGDVDGGGSEDALPVQLAPQHQVLRPGLNRHGEVILVILATGLTQPEPDVPARLTDDPGRVSIGTFDLSVGFVGKRALLSQSHYITGVPDSLLYGVPKECWPVYLTELTRDGGNTGILLYID